LPSSSEKLTQLRVFPSLAFVLTVLPLKRFKALTFNASTAFEIH
jgi:hypothetical protein